MPLAWEREQQQPKEQQLESCTSAMLVYLQGDKAKHLNIFVFEN